MNTNSPGPVQAQEKGRTTHPSSGRRILIAMSGGRNSAVAAAILRSQGYDLHGIHFQVGSVAGAAGEGSTSFGSRCCLLKSVDKAKEVCRTLGIPLEVVEVGARFRDKVVDPFIHDLLSARLPNPCIPCNLEIRFEALFRKAEQKNCEFVATGHHVQVFQDAQVADRKPTARLLKAINPTADQSYFLFGLTQKELLRLMTPIGGFQEAMIERLAKEFELPLGSEGNRQEACFLNGEAYKAFVDERSPPSLRPRGAIKLMNGTLVGDHGGLHHYLLGQTPKLANGVKEKHVVVGHDLASYTILAGSPEDLFCQELRAQGTRWVRPMDGMRILHCSARTSPSQHEATACTVSQFENATTLIQFHNPQAKPMLGQAIVFYEGAEVLGGAFIEHVGSERRAE